MRMDIDNVWKRELNKTKSKIIIKLDKFRKNEKN